MSANWLESYLVRLGFSVDEPSYKKLDSVMARAEQSVVGHTSGMARKVLEAQTGIVGAFTSISAAILGVVDHSARADQAYRLLGERMMMTKDQAREMSMITKLLNASIEEITWDKELRARAIGLHQDYTGLVQGMKPGFDGAMKGIRDFENEFARMKMSLEFFGNEFAQDLWEKMNPGKAGQSLHDFISQLNKDIPTLADKFSTEAKPVLQGTWEVVKGLGEALKQGEIAFVNMVGTISGDKSIQGTEFSFDHLAKAIGHVGHGFAEFEKWIAKSEKSLGEFASAAALAMSGRWTEAAAELKTAQADFAALNAPAGSKKSPAQAALAGELAKSDKKKDGPLAITPENLFALGKQVTPLTGALGGAGLAYLLGAPGGILGMAITGGTGAILGKAIQETKGQTDWDKVKPYWGLSVPGLGPILSAATAEQIKEWGLLGPLPPPLAPPPQLSKNPIAMGVPAGTDMWKLLQPGAKALQGVSQSPAASVMQNGLVDAFAQAVSGHEGFNKKGSIAQRQHNPGALRDWPGVPTVGGYASFPDDAAGLTALKKQIELNIGRGLTLNEFFAGRVDPRYWGYANAKGDNPAAYAEEIGKKLRIATDTPLNQVMYPPAQTPATPPVFIGPPALPPSSPDSTAIKPIAYFMQPVTQPHVQPNYLMPQRDWSLMPSNQYQPSAPRTNIMHAQQNVDLSGISIHVTNPGADLREIARTVRTEIKQVLDDRLSNDLAQMNPLYSI